MRAFLGLLVALASLTAFAPLGVGDDPHILPIGGQGEVANEIVVGFQSEIPKDLDAWLTGLHGSQLLLDDVLHWVSARFPDAAQAEYALLQARQRTDVAWAEHDGIVSLLLNPNDPQYPNQWGFPAIHAEEAWDITLGSHAAKVAVLDTGIQTNHPDLAANACGPFTSFVPTETTISDGHGHGTHVSGTVAAVTNNAVGVAGTSQSCLMGAKVLNAGGFGQFSWVAAGVRWAADNGAHVISMSLGGGASQVMESAVKYAYETKGVLVVAAAGNSGCPVTGALNNGSMIWPALYDQVLAVGSLDLPDGTFPSGFSSCGRDLEVAAPGSGVRSTYRNSGYATLSGTSMATPHVSGVAALVKAQDPAIGAVELRCLLDVTADDLLVPGRDHLTGWGRVNPVNALNVDATLTLLGQHAAFLQACAAGAPAIMY